MPILGTSNFQAFLSERIKLPLMRNNVSAQMLGENTTRRHISMLVLRLYLLSDLRQYSILILLEPLTPQNQG